MGPTKTQWAVLTRSKQTKFPVVILETEFLFDEVRCESASFLGHVVYLSLSFSSDEHHHSHSCLGTDMSVCWCDGRSITILPSLVHIVRTFATVTILTRQFCREALCQKDKEVHLEKEDRPPCFNNKHRNCSQNRESDSKQYQQEKCQMGEDCPFIH